MEPLAQTIDSPLPAVQLVGIWLCIASSVTYLLFRLDRRRALVGMSRLPEGNLLWLSTLGGWPGAVVALRRSAGVRFSQTFRGWLRAIIAAELLFLGMAALPQGSLVGLSEGIMSIAMGDVSARERDARPGRIVMDTERRAGSLSNIVTLSAKP